MGPIFPLWAAPFVGCPIFPLWAALFRNVGCPILQCGLRGRRSEVHMVGWCALGSSGFPCFRCPARRSGTLPLAVGVPGSTSVTFLPLAREGTFRCRIPSKTGVLKKNSQVEQKFEFWPHCVNNSEDFSGFKDFPAFGGVISPSAWWS